MWFSDKMWKCKRREYKKAVSVFLTVEKAIIIEFDLCRWWCMSVNTLLYNWNKHKIYKWIVFRNELNEWIEYNFKDLLRSVNVIQFCVYGIRSVELWIKCTIDVFDFTLFFIPLRQTQTKGFNYNEIFEWVCFRNIIKIEWLQIQKFCNLLLKTLFVVILLEVSNLNNIVKIRIHKL